MDPGASNAAESRHTAVVWTDPARPEPADLLEALTGRGIDAVLVGDRYLAAAEVCRLYRARSRDRGRAGVAAGAGAGSMLALVIVSPEAQGGTCELCEVVARYAGGTRCWMFGPAEAPALRPIQDDDLRLWSGAGPEPGRKAAVKPGRAPSTPDVLPGQPKSVGRVKAPAGPHLRLAGTEASENPAHPIPPSLVAKASERKADLGAEGGEAGSEEAPAPGGRPLLTPEELEMLLGDENPAQR